MFDKQRLFTGTRSRSRGHTCLSGETTTEACGSPPFSGNWGMWGSCTVTCGTGERTRTRRGFCGSPDVTEVLFTAFMLMRFLFKKISYINAARFVNE